MSETTTETVPEGFKQIPTGLGFSDNLQPMYGRILDSAVSLGLVVSAQHQNSMGVCHGGVLVTLADITAATGTQPAYTDPKRPLSAFTGVLITGLRGLADTTGGGATAWPSSASYPRTKSNVLSPCWRTTRTIGLPSGHRANAPR